MNPLIVFHKNCQDGFGAAYAAWKKFGDSAEYIPMQYGDKFDVSQTNDREVYVMDFSFDKETTLQIASRCAKMVWLDHHATSKPLAQELCNAENEKLPFSLD